MEQVYESFIFFNLFLTSTAKLIKPRSKEDEVRSKEVEARIAVHYEARTLANLAFPFPGGEILSHATLVRRKEDGKSSKVLGGRRSRSMGTKRAHLCSRSADLF
ncbi:hypothetical protein KM043_004305 [Ampulex compressa]|nr:hypothetical protein KM043_004305 [Ampulex compressa]